jgi:peroxiredoxin
MRFILALTLLFAAGVQAAPFDTPAPEVGEPAPDFILTSASGETVSLDAMRGNTVILEWTNHDCPYVRKHYGAGNMQRLQRKWRDDGVIWLSVISSRPGAQGHVSPEQALALTAERDAAPDHVLLDELGTAGRAYHARTTPQMALIDADGVLRFMGGIDSIPTSDPADIERAVSYLDVVVPELLAGEALSHTVTRPYGCSVKY